MKKLSCLYVLTIVWGTNVVAQKGNNQFFVIAEGTVPAFQDDQGFGGYLKGAYGIGNSSQLTFMAGMSRFNSKTSVEKPKTTTRLIPLMAGFKQNVQKCYIEPQIGFGELGGRVLLNGDYAHSSVGALFWALGAGYNFNHFFAGLRFESVHGVEGSNAGLWHNANFHYTGVCIGYHILSHK